jgi:hypothetical protein
LLQQLLDDTPANAEVIAGWIEKWQPLASDALHTFAAIVDEAPVPLDPQAVVAHITDAVAAEMDSVLNPPPPIGG